MKATYVKTQLKSIINISKIVTIHYYEFDKNFVFSGESHDFWEMVYVDKGQVQVFSDEKEHILSQGEIIFHKPNEFHSIRALNSSPCFFVISFECHSPAMQYFINYHTTLGNHLRPFISSIIDESGETFVIPKNDPYLKKLKKKKDSPIGGEQLIKTYLEQFFILLIRNITKKGESHIFPSKESMESHIVSAIKENVAQNIEEPIRIGELCNSLGYNRSYLSKLFHAQTGETLVSYTMRKKIQKAKDLIRVGNMNFAQISDHLSFDCSQHFSRVFKRITGITPTEFKNSLNFTNENDK